MKLSTKIKLKSALETYYSYVITIVIGALAVVNVPELMKMDRPELLLALLGIVQMIVRQLIKPTHTLLIEGLTGIKGEFDSQVPPQKFKVDNTVIEASVKDGHIKAKKVAKKPLKVVIPKK